MEDLTIMEKLAIKRDILKRDEEDFNDMFDDIDKSLLKYQKSICEYSDEIYDLSALILKRCFHALRPLFYASRGMGSIVMSEFIDFIEKNYK